MANLPDLCTGCAGVATDTSLDCAAWLFLRVDLVDLRVAELLSSTGKVFS